MIEILIIDDDEDIRFIVKMILERSGAYHVHEAETAAEGKSRFQQIHPDVLLLDYMLPDSRGLDLLREIQSDDLLGATQVIILTARKDPALEAEFIKAGASAIMHKPFDTGEFLSTLESHLESS
ncbi:MAG: response regulator [Candidatus Marinimicrobia bacterium]|nr:response regulator [Candidatus Neomarinimicrobiota bacterium]